MTAPVPLQGLRCRRLAGGLPVPPGSRSGLSAVGLGGSLRQRTALGCGGGRRGWAADGARLGAALQGGEPAGLLTGKAPGPQPRLAEHHRAALRQVAEEGPFPAMHGVVHWRIIDLLHWVGGVPHLGFQADAEPELRALGLLKLSARPVTTPRILKDRAPTTFLCCRCRQSPRAEPSGEHLAVQARQRALQPGFRVLPGHSLSLTEQPWTIIFIGLRGWAHRS